MEFEEITENHIVYPGEYLLYVPKQSIVICVAFKGDRIRALLNGRLIEDNAKNFKKIKLNKSERKKKYFSRCKACD